MKRETSTNAIAPIVVALILIPVIVVGANRLGTATMVIIGGSATVAFFVWLATSWRRPVEQSAVLVPYILLIAMEIIHMAEEQLTNFPDDLRQVFDIPATFDLLAHSLALMGVGNALALLAAAGLGSKIPFIRQISNYMVWFYVIGPGLVNSVAHITFPILAGEVYFSGIVTVILPTVAGIWTLSRLIKSSSKASHRPRPLPDDAIASVR